MNSTVWQCGGSAYNSGNVIVQALGILHRRYGGSVLWSLIRTKFGQIIFTEGLKVFSSNSRVEKIFGVVEFVWDSTLKIKRLCGVEF